MLEVYPAVKTKFVLTLSKLHQFFTRPYDLETVFGILLLARWKPMQVVESSGHVNCEPLIKKGYRQVDQGVVVVEVGRSRCFVSTYQ